MGAPDTIGKVTSMKGLSSIEPEDWKKITQFLKNMQSRAKRNKDTWKKLADDVASAKDKQKELVDLLKAQFKDKIEKCVYVEGIKKRKPYTPKKSKKKTTSSTNTEGDGKRTPDSVAQDELQGGSLAQEGEGGSAAELGAGETGTPTPKADVNDLDVQNPEGDGNTAQEIKKQSAEKKSETKYYTVIEPPPWKTAVKKNTSDPYIVDVAPQLPSGKELFTVTRESHCSLGKLLLHFVAEPLSNTGKFNEVQLLFYPINEYAMWARGLSVASYPINKRRFQEVFEEKLEKSASMSIQAFLNMLSRNFMQFQGDDIYGLSSFYGKDEKGKMVVLEKYQKDEKAKLDFTESKQEVLDACYKDSPDRRFKKPQIKMHVECVPHQEKEGETILRLHFFDHATDTYSSYSNLWQATSSNELGTVGKYASSMRRYIKSAVPSKEGMNKKEVEAHEELLAKRNARITNYQDHFNKAFDTSDPSGVVKLGEIELRPLSIKVPVRNKPGEFEDHTVYRIIGGPDQLRGILTRNMPSLKYGTEFSGILNASLSTQSDPSMETINMKRQGVGNVPQGVVDDGLPLTIRPVTLSLDTFGCPFLYFGQQFFVDFNTNTTIDDVYTVTGISHNISQNEFKTTVKLVPLNKLGQFRAMAGSLATIEALSKEVSELKKEQE